MDRARRALNPRRSARRRAPLRWALGAALLALASHAGAGCPLPIPVADGVARARAALSATQWTDILNANRALLEQYITLEETLGAGLTTALAAWAPPAAALPALHAFAVQAGGILPPGVAPRGLADLAGAPPLANARVRALADTGAFPLTAFLPEAARARAAGTLGAALPRVLASAHPQLAPALSRLATQSLPPGTRAMPPLLARFAPALGGPDTGLARLDAYPAHRLRGNEARTMLGHARTNLDASAADGWLDAALGADFTDGAAQRAAWLGVHALLGSGGTQPPGAEALRSLDLARLARIALNDPRLPGDLRDMAQIADALVQWRNAAHTAPNGAWRLLARLAPELEGLAFHDLLPRIAPGPYAERHRRCTPHRCPAPVRYALAPYSGHPTALGAQHAHFADLAALFDLAQSGAGRPDALQALRALAGGRIGPGAIGPPRLTEHAAEPVSSAARPTHADLLYLPHAQEAALHPQQRAMRAHALREARETLQYATATRALATAWDVQSREDALEAEARALGERLEGCDTALCELRVAADAEAARGHAALTRAHLALTRLTLEQVRHATREDLWRPRRPWTTAP